MTHSIEPPKGLELAEQPFLKKWLTKLWLKLPESYSVTINPASVSANTTSEQTFTVTGLTTRDIVFVNKPTHTNGLGIIGARVSAANTLAITFANITGSPIDAGSETYLITAIRQ